jgi:hypothetical protein
MPALPKLPNRFLARAAASRQIVEFRRRRFEKHFNVGVVVGYSPDFVMFHVVSGDTLSFDGYVVVPRQHLSEFRLKPERAEFVAAVLGIRKEKVRIPRGIDLSDWASVLLTAKRKFGLVQLHQEGRSPDALWVGIPKLLPNGRFAMQCFFPDAKLDPEPVPFALRSVTQVEFGTLYADAIQKVSEANNKLQRSRGPASESSDG